MLAYKSVVLQMVVVEGITDEADEAGLLALW